MIHGLGTGLKMPHRKKHSQAWDDGEDLLAQIVGSFLMLLGGAGVFLLALPPWDFSSLLPRALGIIACGSVALVGEILLQPPRKRGEIAEKLLTPLLAFVRQARGLVTRARIERKAR